MSVGLISSAFPTQPTNLNGLSFAQAITKIMPNGHAPLFGLTSLLKSETATAIEHGYFSKTMVFPSVTLTSAIADGTTTTFPVASTADVTGSDMFLVASTQEVVMVSSVPNSTSVVVVRGIGTTTPAAIASGVVLYNIGNAFEEGSVRPTAVNIVAQRYVNYTQVFRNSWAVTKTAAAIPQIAGTGYVAEAKSDCAAFHARAIETSLFFGQKYMGTSKGQPLHTQEGLIARVTASAPGNITTLGSTTNWTQLEAALDPTLQTTTDPKGSNNRTVFVGGTTLRVLTNVARLNSSYQITTTESSWGLRIGIMHTPRGTFELIEHPLFNAYGASSPWAKMAVICDLNAYSLAYLRPTSEAAYNAAGALVDNGIDAEGGTLTTELTSVITNPAAFGIIYNFTAAAAG